MAKYQIIMLILLSIIGARSLKGESLRWTTLMLLAIFLLGCGGSAIGPLPATPVTPVSSSAPPAPQPPPTVDPPPAEAQTYLLNNFSAVVQYNTLKAAGPFATGFVKAIVTGSPVTLVTNTAIALNIGDAVTISNTFPASAANNGSKTLLSVTNLPCCTYTYTDAAAVNYADEACNDTYESQTYDGFSSVARASGNIHVTYREGWAHFGACTNDAHRDGRIMWMYSTDEGATFSQPVAIYPPSAGTCTGGFNCDYRNGIMGVAANGDIAIAVNVQDGVSGGNVSQLMGYCSAPCISSGHWSALTDIGLSPDGNIFYEGDQIATFPDGTMGIPLWDSVNKKTYIGWSCDNGHTWRQPGCRALSQVTAPGYTTLPTNEIGLASAGGSKIIAFTRNAKYQVGCVLPCGPMLFSYSNDMGATWVTTTTAIGQNVATTLWEDVAPFLYSGPNGQVTLIYGERDNDVNVYTLRSVTFMPASVIANVTALPLPQDLWSGAFTDFSYPGIASAGGNNLFLAWYSQTYSISNAKIHSMAASYKTGAAIAISGSGVYGQVIQ